DKKIDELIDLKFQDIGDEKFVPGVTPVPVSGKVIGKEEIRNMIEASLDGWLTTGRFNKLFEKKIASAVGAKIAITVNSGSSANLVAFMTLTSPKLGERAIKPGDEVITVAAGFPTTVNPSIQFGAVPVFVDIDIPTYNINIDKVENAITKKTKAIMIAHSLGNPFNLKKIREICDKNNLWLVQDTCDALGSKFDNKKVGFYGDIGTLSFYPAHHITMGEGGVVYTNSMILKRIAESFRDWGRDCYCEPGKDNTCKKRFDWKLGDLPHGYDHKYIYSHCGYNLKITDMQAACGVAQIDKLESFINKRNSNFDYLKKNLLDSKDKFILPEATENSTPSWFGFLLTIRDNQIDRNKITQFLNEKKIGTRLLFSGNLIKQPYMKDKIFKVSSELKNTEIVMKNSFWVGVYPGLQNKHLDYILENIKSFKN
ncbi:lipopolysaccharide biosynthesis protein RfbH, partial [Candidatus Pelagibacter ubique]|nr:lipopolysaccharide biosynthesis protein RfbH [Candidatus Pelagibacter ubique]